ncbi:MAG: acyl--CoA ligase [Nitrospira sp.]|nr:acyl--CoA ligase [Nitrospira sp.]
MLADHFQRVPAERGASPALIAGDTVVSYSDLGTRIRVLVERWQPLAGQRVGLALHDPAEHVAAVAALDALRCHVFLAGSRSPREITELADRLQWNVIVWNLVDFPQIHSTPTVPADIGSLPEGTVTLLTSGTTGNPKAANHTWSTLTSPVRRGPRYAPHRWLCAYPLYLYAGTQVMLQALLNWSALVLPPSLDPTTVARTMRAVSVTHASGTPTFWRQLLLFAPHDELSACGLEQITMGGETVTQRLLDQLSGLFPQARLVHIYASTELGRLFSVTDKREGFPAEWLDRPPEKGIELRIVEGELVARSHNAMLGYDRRATGDSGRPTAVAPDGWVATGDLVERHGDRVLFRGRKTDIINVGGRKVMPATVELVLREATGVGDVRVYGKGSSLVGQLVAADIVLARGSDESAVRGEINRIARGRLAPHEVPRLLRVVESIAHNGAMKVVRSGMV